MSTFKSIIEKASNKINLDIQHPQSLNNVERILDNGLVDLYKEAFSKPPYNESYTDEAVKNIIREGHKAGGLIFTAHNAQGVAVAMVMSLPLCEEPKIVEKVGNHVSVPTTSYFAEDMVREDLRRNGISAAMKSLLLEANHLSGFTHVLLRTTSNNYRQISAVSKAGGFTLKDVFQEVSQTRKNGMVELDKRGFYMFATDPELESSVPTLLKDVAFIKPGGNDTAIVFDSVPRSLQPEIGSRIQMTYPNIEQVMFVEKGSILEKRGQMAGGEFCGNATRAYAFLLAEGKEGMLDVEVSGSDNVLPVDLTKNSSRAAMPIYSEFSAVKPLEEGLYRVDLMGISYIVAHESHAYAQEIQAMENDNKKKDRAKAILDKHGMSDMPASGVILLKQNGEAVSIDPFVYVRDAGTLYYETACGSGSTAAALVISHETKRSVVDLSISQPSGMRLVLDVERAASEYVSAFVGGEIEVLYRGSINLSNEFKLDMSQPLRKMQNAR